MPTDPKSLLARAETPAERKQAVIAAMDAGMPLHEIEGFLDWADAVRTGRVEEPVPQEQSAFYELIKMSRRDAPAD